MNTNPDEAKLALWLEDELHGAELAEFEPWALARPEHVAAREEIRLWKRQISSVLLSQEEPPYPDFFNSKVLQSIRESETVAPSVSAPVPRSSFFWKSWLMPASAFAGMALAFWMGTKITHTAPQMVEVVREKIDLQPIVYTPDGGVNAVWTSGTDASVIVLEGVSPIPDAMDFSETVYLPTEGEVDSTAGQGAPTN